MKKTLIHHGKMETIPLKNGHRYGIRFNSEPVTDRDQLHYHDFYEIFISISGEMKYEVEGESFDLQMGDVLFIPPHAEHRPVQSGLSGSTRCILQLDQTLPEELLDEKLPQSFFLPYRFKLSMTNLSRIINLMRTLQEEQPSGQFGHTQMEQVILTQILILLVRSIYCAEAKASSSLVAGVSSTTPQIHSAVVQLSYYIDAHFARDISLQAIARQLGVERARLSREFKQVYDQSPHEYLMNRRLSSAYEIILAGTPPTQAAAQSGFHDYSNFYRQFRRRYGISPGQCGIS